MTLTADDLRGALATLGECVTVDGQRVTALVRRGPSDDLGVEGDVIYMMTEPTQLPKPQKGQTVVCSQGRFKVRRVSRLGSGLDRIELGA